MSEIWNKFREDVYYLIASLGINPVYIGTLFLLLFSFIQVKKIKKWDQLELHDRFMTTMLFILTGLGIFISIITLLAELRIREN